MTGISYTSILSYLCYWAFQDKRVKCNCGENTGFTCARFCLHNKIWNRQKGSSSGSGQKITSGHSGQQSFRNQDFVFGGSKIRWAVKDQLPSVHPLLVFSAMCSLRQPKQNDRCELRSHSVAVKSSKCPPWTLTLMLPKTCRGFLADKSVILLPTIPMWGGNSAPATICPMTCLQHWRKGHSCLCCVLTAMTGTPSPSWQGNQQSKIRCKYSFTSFWNHHKTIPPSFYSPSLVYFTSKLTDIKLILTHVYLS